MDMQRAGGFSLIFAAVAMFVLIFVHPAHGGGTLLIGHFALQDLVHGLALVIAPVMAFGAIMLARYIGLDKPANGLALAFFVLGCIAVMAAATFSGLVTSQAIATAHDAVGPDRMLFGKIGRLSVWINRGFANVHVAYFSIAMLLWDLGWKRLIFIRAAGVLAALGLLVWQLSGSFEPNVHTMPFVVGIQGAWLVVAAVSLMRQSD